MLENTQAREHNTSGGPGARTLENTQAREHNTSGGLEHERLKTLKHVNTTLRAVWNMRETAKTVWRATRKGKALSTTEQRPTAVQSRARTEAGA